MPTIAPSSSSSSSPSTTSPSSSSTPHHKPNHELTPADRARIHGRALAGARLTAIAETENLPRSTVASTLKKIGKNKSYESKPRSGRKKKHSSRDDRRVFRCVRLYPKASIREIRDMVGDGVSEAVVKRVVRESGGRKVGVGAVEGGEKGGG